MCDVVVTVPKNFTHPAVTGKRGLAAWVGEGDAAGDDWSGERWWFTTYGTLPEFTPGDRCYIVCEGLLRGYAPLVDVLFDADSLRNGKSHLAFVRAGDAVAITIAEEITGFRGWRHRWWERADEMPFPDWKNPKAKPFNLANREA